MCFMVVYAFYLTAYIVTLDSVQFFAANGFPCPTLHNPSDHYLRIINKDFELVSKLSLASVYLEDCLSN